MGPRLTMPWVCSTRSFAVKGSPHNLFRVPTRTTSSLVWRPVICGTWSTFTQPILAWLSLIMVIKHLQAATCSRIPNLGLRKQDVTAELI